MAEQTRGVRNPRYDVLFEPVKIGPVTAPNRFYSVPHASGMTNARPHARAAFRGTKAEGGWGVVCTGYVSIHPTSDDAPLPFASLWDDDDVRAHALMTEAVHTHGALAGCELFHGGAAVMNRDSRVPTLSPSGVPFMPTHITFMGHQRPRPMSREDIRMLLKWQADAARRARQAGFDIVYVYAGMGFLPHQFLLPEWNQRTDAYGGSMQNRVRIVRELLEVTHEAVAGRCAVALRISLEQLHARRSEVSPSEAHEVVELLADLPDLWDVKLDSPPTDCATSRFAPEGSHEPVVGFVKNLTDKPLVGVGRFTSPDTMVSQVRRGVLDLIGAARPSIADPFLPRKIDEGREEHIRECIGCNMCIATWHDCVPIRCTQNPTVGEEWRRDWHPERMPPTSSSAQILIVGAGPAGLECALALGRRGYEVAIAEAEREIGGRVRFETTLPGLAAWGRVVDWRRTQLSALPNVTLYRTNRLSAQDVVELGSTHIVIATGARWSRKLYAAQEHPAEPLEGAQVFTPDDIAAGARPKSPVLVYDFDNYYMGGLLAEQLAKGGSEVIYVTPAGHVSAWAVMTNEQPQVYRALDAAGVRVRTLTRVTSFGGGDAELVGHFAGRQERLECNALVIVGTRYADDELHSELIARGQQLRDAGTRSVTLIGDALAPGTIAQGIYSGHYYARELDADPETFGFRRDAPLKGS